MPVFLDAELVINDCADLAVGDQVGAWKNGQYLFAGTVTDLHPEKGLFWVREHALNERRLINLCEFEVSRPGSGNKQPNCAAA